MLFDLLGLLEISTSLNRGQYLALHQAGLLSKEAVYALTKEQIVELVGERGFQAIEEV